MPPKASLPPDWDRFLDQVQENLGHLLNQVATQEDAWKAFPAREPFSLSPTEEMRKIHDGLDGRLASLQERLQALDQELGERENEALDLQLQAKGFRVKAPNPSEAV